MDGAVINLTFGHVSAYIFNKWRKILFWIIPTVWWMILFIIVSYLLGWPHKKLTMSLIDLFPSANDVSTGLHVARVHSVLSPIIDSYYLPLMIICCEQENIQLDIWCGGCHDSLIIPDQGLLCLWHCWTPTMETGKSDIGWDRQHRKQETWMLVHLIWYHLSTNWN